MRVIVERDSDRSSFSLVRAEEFDQLDVLICSERCTVVEMRELLSAIGHVDEDGLLYIRAETLRRLAGVRSRADDWRVGLSAMFEFARARGWSDGSGAMRARIEWALDPAGLRQAFSHFATGVVVIAAQDQLGAFGMSCNSFTSVSLNPALVAFCPAKTSSTWPRLRATGGFCANVLADHHERLARQFSATGADRFAGVEHAAQGRGLVLADALAWFECQIRDVHAAGDHHLVIAEILAYDFRPDSRPLVFYSGTFGTLSAAGETVSNRPRGKY